MDADLHDPSPSEPSSADRKTPRQRREGVVSSGARAFGVLLGVGLVALLVYGVFKQSSDTSIDDSLARSQSVAAPTYRLQVLRRGALGSRLQATVSPALADGWLRPRELQGTPYVLNIWASWCVPCREEAPRLVREWRRARAGGTLFLGLDMEDAREDARNFMDHFGVDYLNIRDPSKDTARRYGATGIPETYFVSARGDIVGHVIGVVTTGQLRAGIAAAVSGRPEAARPGGAQRPVK